MPRDDRPPLAKLREGTEILRTGGGIHLTAAECNELLDEVAQLTRIRDAGLLLRADIPCSNGCGCEDYDYCAAEMWDKALAGQGKTQADDPVRWYSREPIP